MSEFTVSPPGDSAPPELSFVAVLKSDLQHILDVYIDNGMVEDEDEHIINRLWKAIHPDE